MARVQKFEMEMKVAKNSDDEQLPEMSTIKSNLVKAFGDKANEDLPEDLLKLIGKLREQDERDVK